MRLQIQASTSLAEHLAIVDSKIRARDRALADERLKPNTRRLLEALRAEHVDERAEILRRIEAAS